MPKRSPSDALVAMPETLPVLSEGSGGSERDDVSVCGACGSSTHEITCPAMERKVWISTSVLVLLAGWSVVVYGFAEFVPIGLASFVAVLPGLGLRWNRRRSRGR